jgi:hypothetical protein
MEAPVERRNVPIVVGIILVGRTKKTITLQLGSVCLLVWLAGWLAEGLFTLGACSHQRNPIGLNRIELAGRGMIIHDFS